MVFLKCFLPLQASILSSGHGNGDHPRVEPDRAVEDGAAVSRIDDEFQFHRLPQIDADRVRLVAAPQDW